MSKLLTRLTVLSLLAGCNGLTGIGNLSIEGDSGSGTGDDSTGAGNTDTGDGNGNTTSGTGNVGNNGSGNGNGSGTGNGNGGATTGNGSTGAGNTPNGAGGSTTNGNGTTTSGAGPTTSGPDASTGDGVTSGGPSACEYPPGPYGNTANKTLSPNESWNGFAPGAGSSSTITVEDLFDCDGSKGINAVIFTTAQTSCGPCQQEAQSDIAPNLASWNNQGIVVVTLMYGGGASSWRNYFDLQDSYVVDDNDGTFFTGNGDATPTNVIWNPRNGKVVEWWQGSGGLEAAEQLAAQNAN